MSFMDELVAGVRPLGEQFMETDVTITTRLPYAADDPAPFGDDTLGFQTTTTVVKGWVVAEPTTSFSEDVNQIIQSGLTRVRVPFGTKVEPGDKVLLGAVKYTVVDSTAESDLAVWVVVYLRRVQ